VDACGGLDDWFGETEPEPESRNEPSAASWLIRDEIASAPPAEEEAGVEVVAVLPVWAPLRTRIERTPKPATAAPAEAILSKRARRRAGARREGARLEAAVDMHP